MRILEVVQNLRHRYQRMVASIDALLVRLEEERKEHHRVIHEMTPTERAIYWDTVYPPREG